MGLGDVFKIHTGDRIPHLAVRVIQRKFLFFPLLDSQVTGLIQETDGICPLDLLTAGKVAIYRDTAERLSEASRTGQETPWAAHNELS